MNGLLIAVCGLDGSGKTTQINLLKDWLEGLDQKVILTKQPTDNYRNDTRVRLYLDNGKCISMEGLAKLAAADRHLHVEEVIKPNLNEGGIVISDRYLYSSIAFFAARGLEVEYIKKLNSGVKTPDLTIYLDIKPDESLERVMMRDGENLKFEEQDDSVFKKVRHFFIEEALPKDALILDASNSKEIIHEEICRSVKKLLERGN
ncbi:dTMP kinase [Shouchella miscanthi]|uniref:Thymidylate kinase n=1 Tax=Shouchella miscanthi TaxID=2598861 RepID=A0ABU6NPK7_9BACI|nr:dTMP kinase [Shouchella miscanthi]MED4129454.1 dTMP kinase [Shouchella miscanthi]